MKYAALFAAALPLVSCGNKAEVKPVKNVILMIPDGNSIGVLSIARWYKEYLEPQDGQASLSMDSYLCGLVKTHCSDSPLPESSAAISALMTGHYVQGPTLSIYPKANPGQDIVPVCADSTWQPLATVMEGAKILKGKATGLVVTVSADHATPAGTMAHSVSRGDHNTIIRQMASNNIDVVFGGGVKYVDDDVKAIFDYNGTEYIEKDAAAFRAYNGNDKVWALFADKELAYDVDRDDSKEPSLSEMTEKAISLLSKNENGFFLMVEGSKVDYAAHGNDIGGLLSEFNAFDKAVKVALDFARKDGNTTVIVVPDHGTAGPAIGDRKYSNYSSKGLDSAFVNVKGIRISAPELENKMRNCDINDMGKVFKENTGIDLNSNEIAALKKVRDAVEDDYMKISYSYNLQAELTKIIMSRTHVGYVSGSHTSEDVFLAVYNPNNQRPTGLVRSVELNKYMADVIGLPESLAELTSDIYVRHDVLLKGHQFTIEGEKDKSVLNIDGGKLLVPANRSYVILQNGEKLPLGSLSVFVPQNGNFYISKEILNML